MNIIQRPSPNMNTGRGGWVPDMIVCHTTEGSFDGAVSWLTNPESVASAHFVVARDGRVIQLVQLADTAWSNGTSTTPTDSRWFGHATLSLVRERATNANRFTVSIEHEGKVAETGGALAPAQLDTTVALITHIRTEIKRLFAKEIPVNRQHIVGHHEINPRTKSTCPGPKFPFDEIIRRLNTGASAVTSPIIPTITQPPTPLTQPAILSGPQPSDWAAEAWAWAISHRLTDGTNPQGTPTREQMVTLLHRYHTSML